MAHTNNKLSIIMKYEKTLAVLAGLTFAGSLAHAQIAVGDNLSISGFSSMSYNNGDDDTNFNVDEVEIDFGFSFDKVSAEVHLQSEDLGDLAVEQAFISTDINGITISAGRMLNLLGFESDELTGLSFSNHAYENNPTRRYNEGVRGAFSQGDLSIAASVLDNYSNSLNGTSNPAQANDLDEIAFEVAASYTGIENLSVSLGYASSDDDSGHGDFSLTNLHASYSLGQITLGGEYNDWEIGADEVDAYLLMATYAVNDALDLAIRYSEEDSDTAARTSEKTSVSASYTVSDNLLTRVEYNDGEVNANENDEFVIQGILSF